jgi:hypothetical protein
MMKTGMLILSFLGIIILQSCKPTVYEAGKSSSDSYEEKPVIYVTGTISGTKDELFNKAVEWAETHFTDKRCMTYGDKGNGLITGKYLLHYNEISAFSEFYSKVSIRVNDNKVEMSMDPVDLWKLKCFHNCDDLYSEEQAMSDMNSLCNEFLSDLK